MVDPQVRLQNIAIETQELLQQRSMAWTETTNRATMFMTVVGASVFALALVGNATAFGRDFLLFALVVLPVVLLIGLTTLGRVGELDVMDWHWVQGLNRLRHARLELDPDFRPYLVSSPHDDLDAVLETYAIRGTSNFVHGLYVLPTLIALVSALIGGFLTADILLLAGSSAEVAAFGGIATFVLLMIALPLSGYRGFAAVKTRWQARFPTPTDSVDGE